MSETASLGDLFALFDQYLIGKLNVSLPATILSYNATNQTATVQIVPAARRHDPETNAWVPEPFPPIANVPVVFPSGSGGAYTITWPLLPGDPVLLVVCDRSTDEWRATGAPQTVPQDVRRLDLTDAVALPGYHPPVRPILPPGLPVGAGSGTPGVGMVLQAPQVLLGSSAAADPPVTESRLQAFITQLLLWLGTHTHSGVTTGPGVSAVPVQVVDLPTPGPLGALKVRVE
jgi:hypothetical protein